jgi:hypothetical protein
MIECRLVVGSLISRLAVRIPGERAVQFAGTPVAGRASETGGLAIKIRSSTSTISCTFAAQSGLGNMTNRAAAVELAELLAVADS